MVTFTFTMWHHFSRLVSAPFISSCFATFGCVRFTCATRGKHNAEFTKGGWKVWSYFKAICGPKFTKFSDNVGSPLYFPTHLPDCLCHVSFKKYSPLSLEVVEKRNKCKVVLAHNSCGRDGFDFSIAVCSGKVWLSSVCWSPSAKLAMKQNTEFTEGG